MSWHFTAAAAPLLVGAVLMLGIAALTVRRRPVQGGVSMGLVALAVCVYVTAYAMELGSGEAGVRFWLKVQYLGIANVPPLALTLALAYTGRHRFLSPLHLGLLFAIPFTTCLLALTNESHELIWRAIQADTSLGFTRTLFERGAWYGVHNTYVHCLLAFTVLLLARSIARAQGLFRRQLVVLLVAMLVPVLVHALYLATPIFGGLDPNPYALIVTAVTLAWGMFESSLMDLVPVAREAVFASQRDPVLVADRQDRLVDLNPAAQALLGLTASAVGRPLAEVFPAWSEVAAGRSPREAARVPLRLTLAGQERHFEASLAPLAPRPGTVEGRLLVLADVTERRQAERLREDLVGTLVHDLRNPLTVVRAAVDLIEMESPGGAHAPELVMAARQASDRLLDLVRALLDVHGLETRRLPISRSRVEVAALVADAVGMQAPLARARELQLSTDVPAGLPAVSVDAALISRVLQNLLGNALKFTPAGGRVRVAARQEPEGVAVAVSDDGPGVAPGLRPRLFQAFAHGEHLGRGTGLGLAFCRLAVEAHGGRIWAESDPGKGAAFSFTLPAAE